ncbi:MAG TPA: LysR family transcriptional regulator [Sphingobium sp.]|nr:LysR family transcriptional regulator [Sphingobium sp.]
MTDPGTPTFEQLRVFLAVVESGSFAAAGRRLNRAVSVISYTIANLEAQLGLALFARQGARKSELTAAGRAVLAQARTLAADMDGLRATVKSLLDGLESELDLAIDVMLPGERIGQVLRSFQQAFPTVALRLHVEALGGVAAMVVDRKAVLGISGPLVTDVEGLDWTAAGLVAMVPVAAPDHPLGHMAVIPPGEGRKHIQLVLSDRSRFTEGRDFAVISPHTWRLADLGAKHALLREGIGWGNMPLPLIQSDLAVGALLRLAMPDHPGGIYGFSAIWRRDTPPGPAASWLRDQFVTLGQADRAPQGLADV